MRSSLLVLTISIFLSGCYSPKVNEVKATSYRYQNQIDVVQISAVEINRKSTIDFAASFVNKSFSQKHTFTLSRLNPKTNEYDVIGEKTLIGKAVSTTFEYVETISSSFFLVKGMNGPRFKISFNIGILVFEPTFDANFGSETRYAKRLYTYHSDKTNISSSSNAIYINESTEENSTFIENYNLSDEVVNSLYEFNNQNYFDPSFPLFSYIAPNNIFKKDFYYDETFIFFEDKHNAFPYLRNQYGYVKVIGKLEKKNYFYNFVIDEDLYIDPLTRITYRTPINSYLKVNKLFFPFEIASEFNKTDNYLTLFVYGAGYNRETIVSRFDLGLLSTNILGDCATSSYCVSAISSDADFSIGTTEEIDAK